MTLRPLDILPRALAFAAIALNFAPNLSWPAGAATFLPTASMNTARGGHTATVLDNGKVLIVGGNQGPTNLLASAELYEPATHTWTMAGHLATRRDGHAAILLKDGRVLVAGGTSDGTNALASAELYDPAKGTWTNTASLHTARIGFPAVRLTTGLVLVVGGSSDPTNSLASAELYDPVAATWMPTTPMAIARSVPGAVRLTNGLVLVAGGRQGANNYLASAELYDPASATWQSTGDMTGPRASAGGGTLHDGRVLLVAGRSGPTNLLATAELYDPASGTWTPTGSLSTPRYGEAGRFLNDGTLLVAGGVSPQRLSSAEVYDPSTGTWSPTASLNTARFEGTASLLADHQVLVCGGFGSGHYLASAELYDPSGNGWAAAGALATARFSHAVTLLANGDVLVSGGSTDGTNSLDSAELYDPAAAWTTTGTMTNPRANHTATLLGDGTVLAAGGYNGGPGGYAGGPLLEAEQYDPVAASWTEIVPMNDVRIMHTTTLLADGKLLAAGGNPDGSSELYDPMTGYWTFTGRLTTGCMAHTAVLLQNGKVLVAGGYNGHVLAVAEIYNPAMGTWVGTGTMITPRVGHTATLLPNASVLVAGGTRDGTNALSSAEFYRPAAGTWKQTGALNTARERHTATLLSDGRVLVAGGVNTFSGPQASVEAYDPAVGTWTVIGTLQTARFDHRAVLLVNGKVLVVGGAGERGPVAGTELFDPAPTLTITRPVAGLRVSNAVFTARGTAADNDRVADVQYRLNGAAWADATSTNGWINWTAELVLTPGTNLFQAVATDSNGSHSTTGSVSVLYVATDRLLVQTSGQGKLTPNYSNAVLEIGKRYSVKAGGLNGYAFSDWVLSSNWTGGIVSTGATLQFIMQSNLTVEAEFTDVTRPSLKMTAPAPNQRWSNAVFTVRGTARDNGPLAAVWCMANGVSTLASSTNGWSNWSVDVALTPGTNLVQAYGEDAAENFSPTNGVKLIYVLSDRLTLGTTGRGSVSPNYSNAVLQLGASYRITATPAPGYVFSNWLDGAGAVLTYSRTLQFGMESNLVLIANFVPNPFIAASGTYQGLFYDADGAIQQAGSGLFNGTVNSNGSFSASFQQAAKSFPVSGQFSVSGTWQTNAIKGWTNVSAWLQLDLAGGDVITGGVSGLSWTAELNANRALYSKASPAPERGQYTLVLPGSADATLQPGGNGSGTVNVDTNGDVTFKGILGDGTRVVQSAIVSKAGRWGVYIPLYANQGSLLGWLSFTNEPDSDLEGRLSWIKPARAADPLYPEGFTNQTQAAGSRYVQTIGVRALDLTNGLLILTGGNLSQDLTNEFTLRTNNVAVGNDGLSVTITNSTGLLHGSVTNPLTGNPIQFDGAVFQKRNAAYGTFLGTNQSGAVFAEREE